ncbi:hypothetical protein OEZ49_09095 [Ruegeria sp. WL0004]|uniref:P/Homo B domain-containing protein n=1 Tax=Ruegeria marisflavi TaxID=2984152 RepID=A0ABT2WPT4_9RHOB|nr:calcium-binding protein [Ruegeria sp. WL0004]MCU9837921.1 hypothetical protein [Ruegeria sp. WL0004]
MVDPSLFTTVSDNSLLPFGGTLIAQGDDNEEGPFDITAIFESGFTFGSQTFTEMIIGTNGGVTFNLDVPEVYINNTLLGVPFSIAPFNDDMDTRTLPPGPNPGVYFDTNTDRDSVVVTWNNIGRFSNNVTTPNTFQLEIMDLGDGDAELIFRFFDMQGSNSGFQMGAATDDGLPIYLTGGSATDPLGLAADLETLVGNTGVAGVWQMRVIDGQLQSTDFGGEVQTGNSANNTLNGTGFNDVLSGGAGNDTILGLAGIDTLNGNEDNDSISGGGNADLIHGDDGDDTLRGDDGNDTIFGDSGDDVLYGGSGTNELEGGAGADALDGIGGNAVASYSTSTTGLRVDLSNPSSNTGDAAGDTYNTVYDLRGSAFADELVGDSNNNDIFGGSGNDSLTGNAGIDLLEGNEGDDLLNGGEGNDTLDGGLGADNLIGGTGNDFASYRNATTGIVADLADRTANTGEAAGDAYSEIIGLIGSKLADTLAGNTSGNDLRGDDGDDVLIGRDGNDTLRGDDQDDILNGGLGADQLNGGAGTDTASYADATSGLMVVLLNPGSNTGEAAGDTYLSIENLLGSGFDDNLTGNSSANLIEGGTGNDTLFGEGGDDTLRGGTGEDGLNGGTGSDTADYSEATAGVNADLSNAAGNTGEARGDTYSNIENLMGTGFGDTLTGTNGDNTLSGMAGDDLLHGNGGTDNFDGGEGSDTVSYSGGSFVVVDLEDNSANAGEAAGDTFTGVEHLIGTDNSDDLLGDDAGNNLFGGGNVDNLNGRGGDDTLRGGAGNDSLTGGSGADHFMVETGMGNDVVTDFALGEDSIDFSLLSSAERDAVTFSTNGSGHRVMTLGDGSTMTLTGVAGNSEPTGAVTISGTPQVGETLTANSDGVSDADGIDTSTETGQWLRDGTPIAGATGETYTLVAADIGTQISVRYSYTDNLGTNESVTSAATVPVTSGSLTLVGTPAPDTLEGGEGDDDLSGLGDNDVLRGFGGNDTLRGGDGADTLNGGDGDDLILGGDTASDLRDVIFGGEGNDSVDAGSGNDLIFGQGGNDTIAGGFGVDEIQGQDGDDVITGSAFSDLVFGGAGNDFVNGGFGHDRINGGSGADKFYHLGIFDHGSDWVQDYNAAEGDVLLFGNAAATRADFQVNFAHTASAEGERAGDDAVQEAFVIYRPTGQIMWALVDGQGQSSINLQIGGDVFDLLG